MFVADVKCSQATWQTVPNSRTSSAKASVSLSRPMFTQLPGIMRHAQPS